MYYDLAM